ncbi:MAG TPA: peptide chain release factor 2 [Patescibacteria group bacterium]|nr:peptide chain release factor 2 [Patescibacteria group bacterium]
MDDINKKLEALRADVDEALKKIGADDIKKELTDLKAQSQLDNFWADNLKAQEIMKRVSRLETKLNPWLDLELGLKDIYELLEAKDPSLLAELSEQLDSLEKNFDRLKQQLKFSGQYDDFDAIVSIYSGAGGTDAQDWAQMLLRMYMRWAEKQNFKTITVDESTGEEAGIKSVTLEINGPYAYGKLKSEHGVHRLVRLSPFNADNLRQTSFAKVEVIHKIDKPETIEIDNKDLKIDVYRSGGHGGQSVNTTDSAVRVTHVPTGITVAIQNERSQLQNKETALTILRSRLAQMQLEQHLDNMSELKGPNQSAEWGNQIRSYVLHPYKQVKDLRTRHETSDVDGVLDGDIDPFINAYLEHNLGN